MYRIAIFKIQPEPDSTKYQMNSPAGTGTEYQSVKVCLQFALRLVQTS